MSESMILPLLMKLNEVTKKYFEAHQINYDPHQPLSIQQMEQHLQKNETFHEHENAESIVVPCGFLLGQVITNTIPGAWWDDITMDPFSITDMSITIQIPGVSSSTLMLYPMRRIQRFLLDHTDSVWSFYELTKHIVEKSIDLSKIEQGIEHQTGNIVFKVRSESDDAL